MDVLMAKRKLLKTKLTRLEKKVDHETVQLWNLDTATIYDNEIQEIWDEFNVLFDDILSTCPADQDETHQNQYSEIADRIDAVKVAVKVILRGLLPQPNQNNGQQRELHRSEHATKLPKINIPTFSGNLLEWTTFFDLFTSNVHNIPNLSGATKLQYLKSYVAGPAAELLQSYAITDANYAQAWLALQKRYRNTREIVKSQVAKFLEMPSLKMKSGVELRKLVDTATSVSRALSALNRPINEDCDIAMQIITNRLDLETMEMWEAHLGREKMPTLTLLLEFLDDRAAILSSSEFGKAKAQVPMQQPAGGAGKNNQKMAHAHQITATKPCVICKQGNHFIYGCKMFSDANIPERREMVRRHSLCFNCMRAGHDVAKCTSESSCKKCHQRHHTMLHVNQPTPSTSASETISAHTAVHNGEATRALLATALVTITDDFGQQQCYRALIDPGADVSFASERCVQQLGVKRRKTNVDLTGLGASTVGNARGEVTLSIGSRYQSQFCIDIIAYVIPRVTGILPKLPCSATEISHLKDFELADPTFHNPGAIDLLLGSDVFFATIKSGKVDVGSSRPVALETEFGWIVGGACPSQNFASSASVNHIRCESKLEEILEKFWRIEEIPTKLIMTKEEKFCEDHFSSTTTRDEEGRFVVELPFRENAPPLGASREIAVKRLLQMERSLSRRPERKQQYIDFMREYQTLGHMELVPMQDLRKPDAEVYYLPHHAVIKESSTSTKLRVVFDASSKTTSGVSLNDNLLPGPKLQDDLFVIVVRFRYFIIAFTADICKMFRQMWIARKHRDFQRIVWRESSDEPVRDYRLTTVTYGTSPAPYQAKRCLKKLATDVSTTFLLASKVIERDFSMDDLMTGHFGIGPAILLKNEIVELMESCCMELRKWSSNSPELLEDVDPKLRETQLPFRIDDDDAIKTLGLYWIPASDQFWFKVHVPPMRPIVTKRTISSDSAKAFDPLGIVGPVTIVSKMILQSLWSVKVDWDDEVPESILEKWLEYRSGLADLQQIKIPRCIKPYHECSYDLIGFSDASEKGICAVVFIRSTYEGGDICVRLVAAKTKLAPLKQVSLPRLELIGALMLVKLMDVLAEAFPERPEAMYAFTDSTVVLAWLAKHPKKWDTFVANRVSSIQEIIPFEQWHHVPGTENPADCGSRGLTPSELLNHSLWWEGPSWLKDSNHQFSKPSDKQLMCNEVALVESRREVTVHHTCHDLSLLHKFSTLSRLQRVTAYCLRFIKNCKAGRKNKDTSFLTSQELQYSLLIWVRLVQQNSFPEEIGSCIAKESVSVKSRIRSLNPFIDSAGILRVGGRLMHAKLSESQRHPIILPNNNILTTMIINYEHLRNLHGGTQLILSSINRRFWITNGRDAVRRQLKKCVICQRYQSTASSQLMGELPTVRVNPNPAFLKTGVDFSGPYTLRVSRGRSNRNYKGYIALFICMATRAIHLEIVTSLSSQAFIAALRRFIGRRRLPADIFSDCGRNFIGADRELRHLWRSADFNRDVGTFLATEGIKWHFNPPGAPHFGGIWEAGIKSVKRHLLRTLGSCILTYEDMATVVIQIEACLNSRPLTQLSSDPNDLSPLTPGHFLALGPLKALPEEDLTTEPTSHLTKWKLMQRVVQHFWKRWNLEYLAKLQQRPKWLSKRPTLQVGDLVLVKDERFPPMKWKMARIVEAHPGSDNLTRVFTIKTADGILKRPLTKLCPLPIDATDG